ncbi:neural cell adhesion molecule 1-like [Dendronephthya gigantea]|uniref:neural cell adhesion molecule 1-like n=1 Tax=Dendronephthya gigantea TaxID=151771 RepID=UPI00106A2595|nr:neural cell adhesion molecule 1-like [Dendronephthya gigantea]
MASSVLKCALLLLLIDSVISNCSNFKWADTVHNNYIWSIVGEWRVVNCSVNDNKNVNATLWLNKAKIRTTDQERRIVMVSKNVFNVTDLRPNDMGNYYCKACDLWKTPVRINVKRGKAFAKPQVTKRPNVSSIVYGSTVTLECSLTGSYNDYEMIWFKVTSNGKFLKLRSRMRSVWSSDYSKKVQKQVLKITNFTKEIERYFCQVKRYAVNHVGRTFVKLLLQELSKPIISNFSCGGNLIGNEKKDHVVNNSVTGTPSPDFAWYKSVNGKRKFIAMCYGKTGACSPTNDKDVEVTMQSFVIKNASYLLHNNVTYICQATNVKGKDEKTFTMLVKTKPRLTAPKSEIQLYAKNLSLECLLSKDSNPANISYSWAYCDKNVNGLTSCDDWSLLISRNKKVHVQEQEAGVRLYRCTVENEINKDHLIWTIVRPVGKEIPKYICDNFAKSKSDEGEKKSSGIEGTFIWQCIAAFLALLLLALLFFTFRRRNQPKPQNYNIFVPRIPVFMDKNGDSV